MIYITGDTHRKTQKFNTKNCPFCERDVYIICGDFGFIWYGEKKDAYWLNWLATKPYTILFVDGNHENFDLLYQYPVEERFGAEVHVIRPNVLHLIRGNIYTIEEHTFLAMGGAMSHDKKYINPLTGKREDRVEGIDWWPQEDITEEEMNHAVENLIQHNWEVDFVLSHTAPNDVVSYMGKGLTENTKKLQRLANNLKFKKWFFGHYHQYCHYDKYQGLYDEIIGIVAGRLIYH